MIGLGGHAKPADTTTLCARWRNCDRRVPQATGLHALEKNQPRRRAHDSRTKLQLRAQKGQKPTLRGRTNPRLAAANHARLRQKSRAGRGRPCVAFSRLPYADKENTQRQLGFNAIGPRRHNDAIVRTRPSLTGAGRTFAYRHTPRKCLGGTADAFPGFQFPSRSRSGHSAGYPGPGTSGQGKLDTGSL